uniref:Zinc phosphodiesterase ELAC protein 2 n=2 Tax=Arion vulgaris TaxID=1028688 RepID=A0A0B7BCI8_9EUPU
MYCSGKFTILSQTFSSFINAKLVQYSRIYSSPYVSCILCKSAYTSRAIGRQRAATANYVLTTTGTSVISHSDYSLKRHFNISSVCRFSLTMGKKNKHNKKPAQGSNTNEKSGKDHAVVVDTDYTPRHRHGMKKLQPLSKVPTKINLVVIGTGGPGTSQSLLVTTEYTRYMFNCGEGAQRLAAMSKSLRVSAFAKLSGLEHIFITHKSWENTGGLLGMALTLEGQKNPDAKVYVGREKPIPGQHSNKLPQITIHGPPGVENIALMAKKFSVQSNMNVVRHEGEYADTGLSITPITIRKQTADASAYLSKLDSCAPAPAKRQRKDSFSTSANTDIAYIYLCKAQPLLPKINVEKCHDAGVTIGPMVGRLQRGESVVLDDGRVIHPEQVTDSVNTDNRPFLILECPSLDFLQSLRDCPKLRPYLGKSETSLAVIVHMTPADVFNSADYQSWMSGFHDSTDHMVMNRDAGEVDLIRVREHQARLNIVSQEVFPMLPNSEPTNPFRIDSGNGVTLAQNDVALDPEHMMLQKQGQVVKACSGLHYVYRGKDGLGFQVEMDEFKCRELQEEFLDIPDIQHEIADLRKTVPEASKEKDEISEDKENLTTYPKVVFLGTGSSEPNLIRAQSCIVVQVSKHSVIILDCGEDSYGQLYRFFGKVRTGKILRKVKAIFISHLHADHHLGVFSILKERKLAFDEKNEPLTPALLIAPIQMRRWLKFYHTELKPITHLFRFVKHQENMTEFDDGFRLQTATFEDIKKELNLTEYKPVEVIHCNNSFGVSFTHANGFKLVYSGDTRPCNNLITAGTGCDLLIHEATHEDTLHEHAKASKHSTFSEAMDVGKSMGAKNIILTHFSQRYAYMVPLYDVTLPQNVGIAFDNMQVCPKTFKYLPQMIPSLSRLFALELQKFESKHIRRLREDAEVETKQVNKSS